MAHVDALRELALANAGRMRRATMPANVADDLAKLSEFTAPVVESRLVVRAGPGPVPKSRRKSLAGDTSEVAEVLRQFPQHLQERIRAAAWRKNVLAGDVVVRQGDPMHFVLVVSGPGGLSLHRKAALKTEGWDSPMRTMATAAAEAIERAQEDLTRGSDGDGDDDEHSERRGGGPLVDGEDYDAPDNEVLFLAQNYLDNVDDGGTGATKALHNMLAQALTLADKADKVHKAADAADAAEAAKVAEAEAAAKAKLEAEEAAKRAAEEAAAAGGASAAAGGAPDASKPTAWSMAKRALSIASGGSGGSFAPGSFQLQRSETAPVASTNLAGAAQGLIGSCVAWFGPTAGSGVLAPGAMLGVQETVLKRWKYPVTAVATEDTSVVMIPVDVFRACARAIAPLQAFSLPPKPSWMPARINMQPKDVETLLRWHEHFGRAAPEDITRLASVMQIRQVPSRARITEQNKPAASGMFYLVVSGSLSVHWRPAGSAAVAGSPAAASGAASANAAPASSTTRKFEAVDVDSFRMTARRGTVTGGFMGTLAMVAAQNNMQHTAAASHSGGEGGLDDVQSRDAIDGGAFGPTLSVYFPGDAFGEEALYGGKWAHTVIAREPTTLLQLSADGLAKYSMAASASAKRLASGNGASFAEGLAQLMEALAKPPSDRTDADADLVQARTKHVCMLRRLTARPRGRRLVTELCRAAELVMLEPGTMLTKQDEDPDTLYVLLTGTVAVQLLDKDSVLDCVALIHGSPGWTFNGPTYRLLGAGDVVGEQALKRLLEVDLNACADDKSGREHGHNSYSQADLMKMANASKNPFGRADIDENGGDLFCADDDSGDEGPDQEDLLDNCTTVVVGAPCTALRISHATAEEVLAQLIAEDSESVLKALRLCPTFSGWEVETLKAIVPNLELRIFQPEETIIKPGAEADEIFILRRGTTVRWGAPEAKPAPAPFSAFAESRNSMDPRRAAIAAAAATAAAEAGAALLYDPEEDSPSWEWLMDAGLGTLMGYGEVVGYSAALMEVNHNENVRAITVTEAWALDAHELRARAPMGAAIAARRQAILRENNDAQAAARAIDGGTPRAGGGGIGTPRASGTPRRSSMFSNGIDPSGSRRGSNVSFAGSDGIGTPRAGGASLSRRGSGFGPSAMEMSFRHMAGSGFSSGKTSNEGSPLSPAASAASAAASAAARDVAMREVAAGAASGGAAAGGATAAGNAAPAAEARAAAGSPVFGAPPDLAKITIHAAPTNVNPTPRSATGTPTAASFAAERAASGGTSGSGSASLSPAGESAPAARDSPTFGAPGNLRPLSIGGARKSPLGTSPASNTPTSRPGSAAGTPKPQLRPVTPKGPPVGMSPRASVSAPGEGRPLLDPPRMPQSASRAPSPAPLELPPIVSAHPALPSLKLAAGKPAMGGIGAGDGHRNSPLGPRGGLLSPQAASSRGPSPHAAGGPSPHGPASSGSSRDGTPLSAMSTGGKHLKSILGNKHTWTSSALEPASISMGMVRDGTGAGVTTYLASVSGPQPGSARTPVGSSGDRGARASVHFDFMDPGRGFGSAAAGSTSAPFARAGTLVGNVVSLARSSSTPRTQRAEGKDASKAPPPEEDTSDPSDLSWLTKTPSRRRSLADANSAAAHSLSLLREGPQGRA